MQLYLSPPACLEGAFLKTDPLHPKEPMQRALLERGRLRPPPARVKS